MAMAPVEAKAKEQELLSLSSSYWKNRYAYSHSAPERQIAKLKQGNPQHSEKKAKNESSNSNFNNGIGQLAVLLFLLLPSPVLWIRYGLPDKRKKKTKGEIRISLSELFVGKSIKKERRSKVWNYPLHEGENERFTYGLE